MGFSHVQVWLYPVKRPESLLRFYSLSWCFPLFQLGLFVLFLNYSYFSFVFFSFLLFTQLSLGCWDSNMVTWFSFNQLLYGSQVVLYMLDISMDKIVTSFVTCYFFTLYIYICDCCLVRGSQSYLSVTVFPCPHI